jgi:hypothetical protein
VCLVTLPSIVPFQSSDQHSRRFASNEKANLPAKLAKPKKEFQVWTICSA